MRPLTPRFPRLTWRRATRVPYRGEGGLDVVLDRDSRVAARVGAARVDVLTSDARVLEDPWRSIEFRIVRPPQEPWSDHQTGQFRVTH